MRRRLGLLLILAAGLLVGGAPQAQAARGLQLGLEDPLFESSNAGVRSLWLDRAKDARAGFLLLGASWAAIAPGKRPPGFEPRNPADPAYSWGTLDAAVQGAVARGLRPVLLVTGAPRWAEGRHRPRKALPGTWKPSPKKLGDFAHAIAARYSGGFLTLPRVRYFQLWAEPNLPLYLTPQWRHHRPFAPKHYRAMLNSFYANVKGVKHSDRVLTGGTAPYGDPGRRGRMQPAQFWRTLLCLRGHRLRPARCRHPAHFDIAAHNPINVGAPTRHAVNRDDISTPDIGKLRRILNKARHTGRSKPKGRKPIWATEIWWDSRPPDPNGVPQGRQARWLEQSFYVLWKQGVRSVTWFLIRDQAPKPNYASTYQSGLFLHDGKAKPAHRAFRFPFVAQRKGKRRARVWGEAPGAGKVQVQRKGHGGWHTLRSLRARGNRVFTGSVRAHGRARLRARAGGETSLAWRLG